MPHLIKIVASLRTLFLITANPIGLSRNGIPWIPRAGRAFTVCAGAGKDGGIESFFWLRTFNHPVAVRINIRPDGSGIRNRKDRKP
jgi:hypothetical protein